MVTERIDGRFELVVSPDAVLVTDRATGETIAADGIEDARFAARSIARREQDVRAWPVELVSWSAEERDYDEREYHVILTDAVGHRVLAGVIRAEAPETFSLRLAELLERCGCPRLRERRRVAA